MSQKRKKRTLVYTIRITVWTDFMEELFSGFIDMVLRALVQREADEGRITKIEVEKEVV